MYSKQLLRGRYAELDEMTAAAAAAEKKKRRKKQKRAKGGRAAGAEGDGGAGGAGGNDDDDPELRETVLARGRKPLATAHQIHRTIRDSLPEPKARSKSRSKRWNPRSAAVATHGGARGGGAGEDEGALVIKAATGPEGAKTRGFVQWATRSGSRRRQLLAASAAPSLSKAKQAISHRVFKQGGLPLSVHLPEAWEAALGPCFCVCGACFSRACPPRSRDEGPESDRLSVAATRWLRIGVLAESSPPVVLYFSFLSMMWAAFVMSGALAIPATILAVSQSASEEPVGLTALLQQVSLGAIGLPSLATRVALTAAPSSALNASATAGGGDSLFGGTVKRLAPLGALGFDDTAVDVRWLTLAVAVADSLGALALWWCSCRFGQAVDIASKVAVGASLHVGEYSVIVRNLPPGIDPEEIVEHLERLYSLDEEGDWSDLRCCKVWRRAPEKQDVYGYISSRDADDEDGDGDGDEGCEDGTPDKGRAEVKESRSSAGSIGSDGEPGSRGDSTASSSTSPFSRGKRTSASEEICKASSEEFEAITEDARRFCSPIGGEQFAIDAKRSSGWVASVTEVPDMRGVWAAAAACVEIDTELKSKLVRAGSEEEGALQGRLKEITDPRNVGPRCKGSERAAALLLTFNNAASRQRCLQDYWLSSLPGLAALQPFALRVPAYIDPEQVQSPCLRASRWLSKVPIDAEAEEGSGGEPGPCCSARESRRRCRRADAQLRLACLRARRCGRSAPGSRRRVAPAGTAAPGAASAASSAGPEPKALQMTEDGFLEDPTCAGDVLLSCHNTLCSSCFRRGVGSWAISVHPASRPSATRWTDLPQGDCEVLLRKVTVGLCVVVLVSLTVAAVSFLTVVQDASDAEQAPAELCSSHLPAAYGIGSSEGGARIALAVPMGAACSVADTLALSRQGDQSLVDNLTSAATAAAALAPIGFALEPRSSDCSLLLTNLTASVNSTHAVAVTGPGATRRIRRGSASAAQDQTLTILDRASRFIVASVGSSTSAPLLRPCFGGGRPPLAVIDLAQGGRAVAADPCFGLCGADLQAAGARALPEQTCVIRRRSGDGRVTALRRPVDRARFTTPDGSATEAAGSSPVLSEYSGSSLVSCMCMTRLLEGAPMDEDGTSTSRSGALCGSVTESIALAQGLVFALALALSVINTLAEQILGLLAGAEGFFSDDLMLGALAQRVAVVQAFNLAVPFLLALDVPTLSSALPGWLPFGRGAYTSATSEWFAEVASPVGLALVLEFLSIPLGSLTHEFVTVPCRIRQAVAVAGNEEELERRLTPPPFPVDARMSRALFLVATTELMRPAYPALALAAAGTLSCLYWSDLVKVFRNHSVPDAASTSTTRFVSRGLVLLVAARCLLAIFIFSEDTIMPSWTLDDLLAEGSVAESRSASPSSASAATGVAASIPVLGSIANRLVNVPALLVLLLLVLVSVILPPMMRALPVLSGAACGFVASAVGLSMKRMGLGGGSRASSSHLPPFCGEMWIPLGVSGKRAKPELLPSRDLSLGWRYAVDVTQSPPKGEWAMVKVSTRLDTATRRHALRRARDKGEPVPHTVRSSAVSTHRGTGHVRSRAPMGSRKLTWEIIAAHSAPTYAIEEQGGQARQALKLWRVGSKWLQKRKRRIQKKARRAIMRISEVRAHRSGGGGSGGGEKKPVTVAWGGDEEEDDSDDDGKEKRRGKGDEGGRAGEGGALAVRLFETATRCLPGAVLPRGPPDGESGRERETEHDSKAPPPPSR